MSTGGTPTPTRSEILRWRLSYARKGVRTSPACTARKKPVLRGWQHLATTDPRRIHVEHNGADVPDFDGILAPTGERFGRWVLDIDDREDLAHLEREIGIGILGTTTEVRTQSGNLQAHFLWPEGTEIRNSTGKGAGDGFGKLDVRGEGGLVMLPPSAGYSFANDLPMIQAPPSLIEWASSRKKAAKIPTEARQGSNAAPFVVGDGPIPLGARHDALASILGSAHDGTRSLADLTALAHEINATRCVPPIGSPEDDDPLSDVDKTAADIYAKPPCRPKRNKDPEVEGLLAACSEHWYREKLPKGGRSKMRDVYRASLMSATKRGEARTVEVDGEEVRGLVFSESTRQLAEAIGTSNVAAWKNLNRLMDMDALVAVEKPLGLPWTFVLLPPEPAFARKVNTPQQPPASLEERSVVGGVNPVRADALGTPFYGWRSPVGNSGGGVEAAVEAFGPQTARALAERLGISRARDLQRRHLDRLQAMGVVVKDGDRWGLPVDHAAAVKRRLDEPYTTVSRRRHRKRTSEGRMVVWVEETVTEASENERAAARVAYHAAERAEFRKMRQKKLARIAAECFGVTSLDVETGEIVAERRKVSGAADGAISDPLKLEAAVDSETVEKLPAQCEVDVEPLSDLAAAVRERLERNPKEAREPAGYLANTVWAYSPPGTPKPTADDVREALDVLVRAGPRESEAA